MEYNENNITDAIMNVASMHNTMSGGIYISDRRDWIASCIRCQVNRSDIPENTIRLIVHEGYGWEDKVIGFSLLSEVGKARSVGRFFSRVRYKNIVDNAPLVFVLLLAVAMIILWSAAILESINK